MNGMKRVMYQFIIFVCFKNIKIVLFENLCSQKKKKKKRTK